MPSTGSLDEVNGNSTAGGGNLNRKPGNIGNRDAQHHPGKIVARVRPMSRHQRPVSQADNGNEYPGVGPQQDADDTSAGSPQAGDGNGS